ncbi:sigma-70 family RNA polymerase sigma factor [Mycolicibacterium sp. F2034L]|uniref:sigma-70 family RNA polymerase sigma factor n=1 Tax=Mycolicibacterium sp. F2034L TaxID=2926422 RepID=UPI00248B37D7|nr:sigma-70 family RNA polymerase sigma factor [Mycolicibacterium sp. F2034L]
MKSVPAHDSSSIVVQTPCSEDLFDVLVAPMRGELLRRARRLTNDGPDAEDLVQDAMFRAYRSFSTFDPDTNVRAWLHRILRNVWINNYRMSQRRLTEVPIDGVAEQYTDGAGPEPTFLAAEPDTEIHHAMAALSDEFRMVVYLADIEGYPCATIAAMMGTPVGTVMSRLHRARKQLRMSLGGTVRRRRLVATADARLDVA